MHSLRQACLAVLLATAAACNHDHEPSDRCSDPQEEAAGIAWDRLSGRVAYARWETDYPPPDSHGCIYLIDVAARQVELLRDVRTVPDEGSAPVGWAKDLAFRPDGSTVTFAVQDMRGKWQLHDLSVETREETTLFVDPAAHHRFPAWSPDGRLAYYSNGPLSNDIYIDAQPVQSYANRTRIAWLSADRFVASIFDDSSMGSLYVADLASQRMAPIVNEWAGSPAVSPDGQKVVYTHMDSEGYSLWVAGIDGSGQTRVTVGYSDNEPAWSADGTSVLFIRSGQGLVQYDFASATVVSAMPHRVDSMAWVP
jgi:Tol biopolymer transport system component